MEEKTEVLNKKYTNIEHGVRYKLIIMTGTANIAINRKPFAWIT